MDLERLRSRSKITRRFASQTHGAAARDSPGWGSGVFEIGFDFPEFPRPGCHKLRCWREPTSCCRPDFWLSFHMTKEGGGREISGDLGNLVRLI